MHKTILIIEDEPGLQLTLSDRLAAEGYRVEIAATGTQGLEKATKKSFDLILLDIMLPEMNGFDVCRNLRSRGFCTPVLMLTARGEVTDKVVGLKLGADDYLTKPFEVIELLARMEALLRRSQPFNTENLTDQFSFGGLLIDFKRAEVLKNDRTIELSAQEYRLLQYFIRNRNKTISRQELLDKVWGYESMPSTRTVDVHVAWLRQKLEDNPKHPQHILTVHKLGYRFQI